MNKALPFRIYTVSLLTLLLGNIAIDSKAQSFVQTEVIKVSGITTDAQIYPLTVSSKQTTRMYYDGFGRPVQTVAMQASPSQKDMIQPVVYDNLGRQTISYLPYSDNSSTVSGSFRTSPITDQASFYTSSTDHTLPYDAAP
jgi:hypothetical protein